MARISARKGAVLIFALWVLSFLTVLAVSVAAGIRQKMILVKRIDERSRMSYVTQAGVKKAVVYIHQQMADNGNMYTPAVKANLHNNPGQLTNIDLEGDRVDVSIVDEEGKINLNKVNKPILAALIARVLSLKDDEALQFAESLLDWRQYGEGSQKGFFSDDYYANLQYPYSKKDANYQLLDEMLLVKGMTKERFERLRPFVTVYGEGRVNINTASRDVLLALGLDEVLITYILDVRRGKDGVEATGDDHVFTKTFDIAAEVNAFVKLEPEQIKSIDLLNAQSLLDVNSFYFLIEAVGRISHQSSTVKVRAVFVLHENKILSWREK